MPSTYEDPAARLVATSGTIPKHVWLTAAGCPFKVSVQLSARGGKGLVEVSCAQTGGTGPPWSWLIASSTADVTVASVLIFDTRSRDSAKESVSSVSSAPIMIERKM